MNFSPHQLLIFRNGLLDSFLKVLLHALHPPHPPSQQHIACHCVQHVRTDFVEGLQEHVCHVIFLVIKIAKDVGVVDDCGFKFELGSFYV